MEVYNGEEGILRGIQPGSFMIDSSTIDPAVSKDVARIASEAGGTYIDAPVSGGKYLKYFLLIDCQLS